jgi:ribonuclease HI
LEDRSFDKSEPLLNSEPQTNNRGELRAIQCALDILDSLGPRLSADFDVYWIWTDSEYSINSLTKWADGWRRHGWKKRDGNLIQNLDLIKPVYEKLLRMPRVTLHHVRSHQDSRKHEFPFDGNAKADALARASIQRSL